jgi:putative transposase
MGRLPRIQIPGYPHHVVMRCNNKETLLAEQADRGKFLSFLGHFKMRHRASLHAYTVMFNHVHLIWNPGERVPLSEQMRDIMANFAKWFNGKYGRKGHLWESRYHATVIENDEYALTCMRYIHRTR